MNKYRALEKLTSKKTPLAEADIRALISPFAKQPGGLLPALTALQSELGWVPEETLPVLADIFNLSRAEVHGTVSFYHDFRREPGGQHVIKICQAEACQAMGSRALTKHAIESLGIDMHQTDETALFSLEPVYCLGNCACSPAVMVDETVYGKVDASRFDEIVTKTKGQTP